MDFQVPIISHALAHSDQKDLRDPFGKGLTVSIRPRKSEVPYLLNGLENSQVDEIAFW